MKVLLISPPGMAADGIRSLIGREGFGVTTATIDDVSAEQLTNAHAIVACFEPTDTDQRVVQKYYELAKHGCWTIIVDRRENWGVWGEKPRVFYSSHGQGWEGIKYYLLVIEKELDPKDRRFLPPAVVEFDLEKLLLPLTRREKDIARYIARGYGNRRIAQTLGLQEQSIKNQVSVIMRKLGCANRSQLALKLTGQDLTEDLPPGDPPPPEE